jgi:hypothetical protein
VGDTKPSLSFAVLQDDRKTVRNLTDHAAYVRWWYADTDPHVVRYATIPDPATGVIEYTLRGDEYSTKGKVFFQWVVFPVQSYAGAPGRGFHRTSGPIMARRVVD